MTDSPAGTPPPRRSQDVPAPGPAGPTPAVAREARGADFWLPVTALVLAAITGVVLLWPAASDPIPASLLGEWTTKYEGYEGRTLAFTETEVHIGIAVGVPRSVHAIRTASVETRGDTTMLQLTYGVDGNEFEMQAALVPTMPARLVFFRPVGLVWERSAGASRGAGRGIP